MREIRRYLVLICCVALAIGAASLVGGTDEQTVGLFQNDAGAFNGYTLFGTLGGDNAYLIDSEGRQVHRWADVGDKTPYLLEDGSIMTGPASPHWVRQFAWDGTLIWEYKHALVNDVLHHDIEVLPNGNVLMIARAIKTGEEAIVAGRDPALLPEPRLDSLHVIEVEPTGPTSGNIVWEWHAWDHLVQDFDSTKDNYGVVADHPELIDLNFIEFTRPAEGESDWHHTNAVDYNEEFDQIVVSVRHFSEIWIIDHSTTTSEAASHSGGTGGKGGDLLYRWGNPQAYGAGDAGDQQLFSQHDSQWIRAGLPGAGNILIFNNGNTVSSGAHSSVVEISSPVDSFGNYALTPGGAFGPVSPAWEYEADFFAHFISGISRLPNGNTLITNGPVGTLIEVTPSGQTVWEYVSPVIDTGPVVQGQDATEDGRNRIFRALRYSPDYPGFAGKDLTPGDPIELPKPTSDLTVTATLTTVPSVTPTLTTEPTVTPTVTTVPTVTRTPFVVTGDVSCDGIVDVIDAALILQFVAGLLGSLACPQNADVDADGNVSAIDATLMLQFAAGLLDRLPP